MPSVVIMKLNPGRVQVPPAPARLSAASAGRAANVHAADINAGRRLYGQVCAACHGPDGNMIADKRLGNLGSRLDLDATVRYIKDPKAPMPKMFPDLLTEQNVADVAAYVHQELH